MKTLLRIPLALVLLLSLLGTQPGGLVRAAAQLPPAPAPATCTAWVTVQTWVVIHPDGGITRYTVQHRACTRIEPDGNGGSRTITWVEERIIPEYFPPAGTVDEEAESEDLDSGSAPG